MRSQNGWVGVKLDELGFVGRGKSRHRPRNDVSLYGGPYPFIQTADIMASDLYITSYSQTYSDLGLQQSKMWDEGTLCMTIAGENTGEVAILKFRACFPDSVIAFVADPLKADVRFVKYYFDTMKRRIKNISRGATQDNLSLDKLLSLELLVPSLPIQIRIGDILSAYDDLIENNTRRIKILEEMAQVLYREWFVNFRFPGHQKVKIVESDLGLIPEGWGVPPLEQVLEHVIGGGWGEERQSDEFTVPAYVIRGTDIPGARHGAVANCPLRWHKESNFKTRKLQADDLVFEVSGGSKGQPVGRSLLVGHTLLGQWDRDVICASVCKLLRPKSGLSTALYCFLIESYTNGVIEKYQVQSTGISNFKFTAFVNEVRMPMPPPTVMVRFREVITPMLDAAASFGKRNTNLRTTRDFLLPKLISGEIPVEAAEEAMEQTA